MIGRPPNPLPMGFRFGKLTVIGPTKENIKGKHGTVCACDCGAMTAVQTTRIRHGYVHSCGCYQKDKMRQLNGTHAMSKTAEYRAWINMRLRCYSMKDVNYISYGGRGITVCAEWLHSFEAFFAHVGPKPSPQHSLERLDTNGNYEPNNVCWATFLEQSNNKRRNVRLAVMGHTKTVTQWSRISGVDTQTIQARIRRGWRVETAIFKPRLWKGRVSKKLED